jgi:hypothetical protein
MNLNRYILIKGMTDEFENENDNIGNNIVSDHTFSSSPVLRDQGLQTDLTSIGTSLIFLEYYD